MPDDASQRRGLDDLDLRGLRTLLAVAEQGSVTAAAASLGVSQSSVSRGVQRLRRVLDDALFVRGPKGMQPTPRLHELLPLARATLDQWTEAARPTTFDPATDRLTLTLAAWDYATLLMLPTWLAALGEDCAGLQLRVIGIRERFPARALESGEADVMVGLFRRLPPGCFEVSLWSDRFLGVCREGHPAAASLTTLEGFAAQPQLLVSPFGKRTGFVDDLLRAQGRQRSIGCLLPGFAGACEAVACSDLVAVLPERLVARAAGLQTFLPPLQLPTFTMQLVWHERTRDDPGQRWAREHLKSLPSGSCGPTSPGSSGWSVSASPAGSSDRNPG
ncbi:MAG: LysR family transcriptional regulator [Myxococcales bacterium]|nr:LysR family transcriptional regulator [Myxococcales bacterium]